MLKLLRHIFFMIDNEDRDLQVRHSFLAHGAAGECWIVAKMEVGRPCVVPWLQAMAKAVLNMVAQQAYTPDMLANILAALSEITRFESWHVRRSVLPVLEVCGWPTCRHQTYAQWLTRLRWDMTRPTAGRRTSCSATCLNFRRR